MGISDLQAALPESSSNEKKERQALLKVLKRLEKDYRLLSFEWDRKKNVFKISLLEPGQMREKRSKIEPSILGSRPWVGTLHLPMAFYEYGYQKKWSLQTQFVYCVSLILESENQSKPFWFSYMTKMEDDFHVSEKSLRAGLAELKREHVIEFVFPKKKGSGQLTSARLPVLYKNNVIQSEEEKETELLKVKNISPSITPDEWKRARAYAKVFDDPYNAQVVRQFVELVKKYPDETLEPIIMKVAQFAPDNSLRSPEYIKKWLERK